MAIVINMGKSLKVKRALVLDADGTIRRNKNGKTFIDKIEDIELMPGIEKLMWRYRHENHLIIIISNQGGVAYGFKTPLDVDAEKDATIALFEKNPIHIYKACMHMPDGHVFPYNHRSLFRKPNIGMLAESEVDAFKAGIIIDWDNSLFVGDRPEDEACAKNAGIPYMDINDFLKKLDS